MGDQELLDRHHSPQALTAAPAWVINPHSTTLKHFSERLPIPPLLAPITQGESRQPTVAQIMAIEKQSIPYTVED